MVYAPLIPPQRAARTQLSKSLLPGFSFPGHGEHRDRVAPAGPWLTPAQLLQLQEHVERAPKSTEEYFPKIFPQEKLPAPPVPRSRQERAEPQALAAARPAWSCSAKPTDGQKSNQILQKALGGASLVEKGLFLNQHMENCDSPPTFQGGNTLGAFTGCYLLLEAKARIPFVCMDLT